MMMMMVETFKADIFIGLQEGYCGLIHQDIEVFMTCMNYCDEVKLGVTFTKTEFIYVNGNVYEELSDRRNIVVIADEAHRTQYGFEAKLKTRKLRGNGLSMGLSTQPDAVTDVASL